MANRSREAALDFLEYVAQKGLMAPATARARKAALGKVLSILSEEEAADVTALDLDEVMTRFSHLQGKGYTPQSLTTYKSRVRSALDDFASYVDNPLGFKPSLQTRERKGTASTQAAATPKAVAQEPTLAEPQPRPATSVGGPMASSILPIPIRADLTVHIQGLPYDLSEAEAKKIATVVQAMAMPT
ncbi:MAG: hypothetical protein M3N07_09785 [Pseudomonadota bacterium]|nr:hypothetical protein [Pseudomonadota bacterium]